MEYLLLCWCLSSLLLLVQFAFDFKAEFSWVRNTAAYQNTFKEHYLQKYSSVYKPRGVHSPRADITPFILDDEIRTFKKQSWAHYCHFEAAKSLIDPYGKYDPAKISEDSIMEAEYFVLYGLFPGLNLSSVATLRDVATSHMNKLGNMRNCAHSFVFTNGEDSKCEKCGKEISEDDFDYNDFDGEYHWGGI
jgi:hypothetical protein